MKKNELIKYVLMLIVSIAIAFGTALTAKSEEFAQNGVVVALIASSCIFTLAELICKAIEMREMQWKGVAFGIALTLVFYFISYHYLLC